MSGARAGVGPLSYNLRLPCAFLSG